MATTEPEPPPLSAADIANRTFARRRKGVNPDEVQAFLQSLSEHVARLQAQVDWHRARTDFLERQTAGAKDAAYARLAKDFQEVVRAADTASARVRAEADAEAKRTVAAAHDEADEIVAAAKAEAEGVSAAAKARAERITSEAATSVAEQPERRSSLEGKIWDHTTERPEWFVTMPTDPKAWEGEPDPEPPAPAPPPPADDSPDDLDIRFDRSLFELLDDRTDDR
jgi:DivIVA domain-containing protein